MHWASALKSAESAFFIFESIPGKAGVDLKLWNKSKQDKGHRLDWTVKGKISLQERFVGIAY